jgi:hypothetical protein
MTEEETKKVKDAANILDKEGYRSVYSTDEAISFWNASHKIKIALKKSKR